MRPTYERLSTDDLRREPLQLLVELRRTVDQAQYGEDLPLAWLSEALERLEELLGAGRSRCTRDTDGDGDCAACARNPDAPCRVQPTMYGIRGHRMMTAEEAAEAQRLYELSPLDGLRLAAQLAERLPRTPQVITPDPGVQVDYPAPVSGLRCPACGSPMPTMHPSTSGGEVTHRCPDAFHNQGV